MNEKQLLDLKGQVEEAKTKANQLKGQLQALMNQLKTNFKLNSVKEAEDTLTSMEKEIAGIEKNIQKGMNELEEKYNIET